MYELRTHVHLKTVLVMDVLESVIVLSKDHSANILNIHNSSSSTSSTSSSHKKGQTAKQAKQDAYSHYVTLCAGERGHIFIHSMSIHGKDISSFAIQLLRTIPLNQTPCEVSVSYDTSDTSTLQSLKSNQFFPKLLNIFKKTKQPLQQSNGFKQLVKSKLDLDVSCSVATSASVKHMQYLKISGQIAIVTNDHNIYSFDL